MSHDSQPATAIATTSTTTTESTRTMRSTTRHRAKGAPSSRGVSTLRADGPPPLKKARLNALSAIAPPLALAVASTPAAGGHRLWVDIYEPLSADDLAVHTGKVQDVRAWLRDALDGTRRRYRRFLVLSGPAGAGKTAAVRVLARELAADVIEWRPGVDEQLGHPDGYEGLMVKFRTFLVRATSCRPLLFPESSPHTPSSSQAPPPSSQSQSTLSSQTLHSQPSQRSQPFPAQPKAARQIILLEDLPNVLHAPTQTALHAALEALAADPTATLAPVVIVVSDAGVRGENGEDDRTGREHLAVDVRSVVPPGLLRGQYVTQIAFNPVAPTLLLKALQRLLSAHFGAQRARSVRPSKDVLDAIVEAAAGDVRSAVMALEMACMRSGEVSKRAKARGNPAALEAATRREQSLHLFHLIGKVLYNKRKGDQPSSSATKKEVVKEREMDRTLPDPPPLPPHLQAHERKASRVDVEMLYADSPIDSSLLSLYVHQNYTQYCDELEECDGIADMLSWIDSSGGETWYQANPHRFHLLTLGTLHALPTPVPRRNQKVRKPAFFEALARERESANAVSDVQEWLERLENPRAWTKRDVAVELGGVLRARSRRQARINGGGGVYAGQYPPSAHSRFSMLEWTAGEHTLPNDDEEDDVARLSALARDAEDDVLGRERVHEDGETEANGWLEGDDIEEW